MHRSHVRFRRFVRSHRPVRLGQSRTGFLLAAALVFLWYCERPAQAAVMTESGFTQDEYLRVEWEYNLEAGTGLLRLLPMPNSPDRRLSTLHRADFESFGVAFDDIRADDAFYSQPILVGFESGHARYRYELINQIGLSQNWSQPTTIALAFPPQGTVLYSTDFEYSGLAVDTLSALPMLPVLRAALSSFVSIRSMPEPTTGILALAGGAAALAGARRHRDDNNAEEK